MKRTTRTLLKSFRARASLNSARDDELEVRKYIAWSMLIDRKHRKTKKFLRDSELSSVDWRVYQCVKNSINPDQGKSKI